VALGIFDPDYDAAVFVDDWKGSGSEASRPVFHMGRLFLKKDFDAVSALASALTAVDAEDWHATDDRSLFADENGPVLDALKRTDSWLFSKRTTTADFIEPRIVAQFKSLARVEGVGAFSREDPYVMGLRNFTSFLWRPIAEGVLSSTVRRVAIFCDRGPWISSRPEPFVRLAVDMNPHLTAQGCSSELVCVNSTTGAAAEQARFLRLVDSEVWAYQRFLTTRLLDGRSPLTRVDRWSEDGSGCEELLSREDEAYMRSALM
jgi:hypothetical protein